MNDMAVAAAAILAVCLTVTILALCGIALAVIWAFYRRVGERDQGVAVEIARALTDAWNGGFLRRGEIESDSLENARLEVERKRSAQHWTPAADDRDHAPVKQSETISVFGEDPLPPEMRTRE